MFFYSIKAYRPRRTDLYQILRRLFSDDVKVNIIEAIPFIISAKSSEYHFKQWYKGNTQMIFPRNSTYVVF